MKNKSNSDKIFIVTDYGKKQIFSHEKLYTKLVSCCTKIGMKNFDIAEDISNAMEHVLCIQNKKDIILSDKDIVLLVIDILENAGELDLSEAFKIINNVVDYIDVKDTNNIKNVIANNFNLKDSELIFISNKISNLFNVTKYNKLPIKLIFEFVEFYSGLLHTSGRCIKRVLGDDVTHIDKIKISNSNFKSRSDIIDVICKYNVLLIEKNVIDVAGISEIFPSIKIGLNLEALIEYFNMNVALIELELLPRINNFILFELNGVIFHIMDLLNLSQKKRIKYPIFLRITDFQGFITKYLTLFDNKKNKFKNIFKKLIFDNVKYNISIRGI